MQELGTASEGDLAAITALLTEAGLPTDDLAETAPLFTVIRDGQRIVAAGALQPFGSVALLRSVVVATDRRGFALGRTIVLELERIAQAANLGQLVLLTQTANKFFQRLGYRVIPRAEAPQAVQVSQEFRSLCPSSATCMVKIIAESA